MPGFAAIADSLINLLHGFGNPAAGLGQNGDWYQRLDAAVIGDSMWVKIAGVWVTAALGPPAVTDLQTAYDGGSSIDITAAQLDITITNTTAQVTALMTLTQDAAVALPAINIVAANAAAGVQVTATGANSRGLDVVMGAATTFTALNVTMAGNSNGLTIDKTNNNAGGSENIIALQDVPTGASGARANRLFSAVELATFTANGSFTLPRVQLSMTPIASGGATTLTLNQAIFQISHTPTTAAGGTLNDTTRGIQITMTPAAASAVIGEVITMTANCTGAGLSVAQAGTGDGISVAHTGTANNGVLVTMSAATGGAGVAITQAGSGNGQTILMNAAATSLFCLQITNPSTAAGLSVVNSNAAATTGIIVNVSNAAAAAVSLSATNAGSGNCITATQSGATGGGGALFALTNVGNAGTGVAITHAGTGAAITISATLAASVADIFDMTLAGSGQAFDINLTNAANAATGITLDHDGAGVGVFVSLTAAANSSAAISVDHLGTGPALLVRDSTGTAGASIEFTDGQTAAVATAADRARLRFNDNTNTLQVSLSGAAYVDIATGTTGVTLDGAYDFGGAGAGRTITADAGAVVITSSAADNNGILQLTKSPAGAQTGSVLTISATPGASAAMVGATVTMGANSTGNGVAITHAGTGAGLFVNQTGASGNVITAQDGSSSVFTVGQLGATTVTVPSGTGNGLTITHSGTVTNTNTALALTATTNTAPGGSIFVISETITTAGTHGQVIFGRYSNLAAGYTGAANTVTFYGDNNVAGTGIIGTGRGNIGVRGSSIAVTTGTNVGVFGNAASSSGISIGVQAEALTSTAASVNIGVLSYARNTAGAQVVGGWFALYSTPQAVATYDTSAALVCDNSDVATNIFVARDNGTAVFTIADTGAVTIVPNGNVVGLVITQGNVASNAHNVTHAGTGIALFINHTGASGDIVNVQDGSAEKFVIEQLGTVDMSGITAGTPNFRFTATSDTPTVVWSALGTFPPDAAPAGYVEITVGGNARYIPFWA